MATTTVKCSSRPGRCNQRILQAAFFTFIIALVLGLSTIPVQAAETSVEGQDTAQQEPMKNGNPIANYWRSVRSGVEGITTESGPYTTNVLIQNGGQNWRQIRNGLIANYGGWLLIIVLIGIALFFAVRGRVRLDEGYSGKRVIRFSVWQRFVHWLTAVTFILLGLTGLIMLFGRALLIPLFGKDAFSTLAEVSKVVHNFIGPLFIVAIVLLIVTFVAKNMLHRDDLKWLASGGGMLRGRHSSASYFNAGEKLWFWLASVSGILMALSGLFLDFPGYGQTREVMQLSEIVHAIVAMVFIAVSFGHIYIGTLGTEGAIDGMGKGHVDANWARQHHDRWYEKMEKEGMVKPAEEMGGGELKGQPGVDVARE